MRSRWLPLLVLVWLVLGAGAAIADRTYDLMYDVRLVPTERSARVVIRLGEGAELVKRLWLRTDPERHFNFQGDGEVVIEEDGVAWTPPETGGELRYTFLIDHLRDDRSYDSRCTKSWALFRGDDLIPPTRARTITGARSKSRQRMRVPEGWTRAVPYPLLAGGVYGVSHPDRGFDRPTGWMVVGNLGAVRETVEGVNVTIAGPIQHGMRRLDMLALMRWTLPNMQEALGEMPRRLLIVGAGDPMWRGGLSGPNSVYVHARRPLIAEDGTSPLLHEVMHAMLGIRSGEGGDWIVEGLAEFYSIELLRRSGTLSAKRAKGIYKKLATRGRKVKSLESNRASGDLVARAVTVIRALDAEIREKSAGVLSMDDVARVLRESREKVTTAGMLTAVNDATALTDLETLASIAVK